MVKINLILSLGLNFSGSTLLAVGTLLMPSSLPALAACVTDCSFLNNGVSFSVNNSDPTVFKLYNIKDLNNQTNLTDFEVVVKDGTDGPTETFEYPPSQPDPNLERLFSYNGNFSSSNSTGYYGVPRKNLNSFISDAYFTKNGVKSVPEPLTILGSGAALGFGAIFKRQYSKRLQKQKV